MTRAAKAIGPSSSFRDVTLLETPLLKDHASSGSQTAPRRQNSVGPTVRILRFGFGQSREQSWLSQLNPFASLRFSASLAGTWQLVRDAVPCLDWLLSYDVRRDLKGDMVAGLSVGFMIIPQGMAYARVAGLPSIYGLYTGFVPCLVYRSVKGGYSATMLQCGTTGVMQYGWLDEKLRRASYCGALYSSAFCSSSVHHDPLSCTNPTPHALLALSPFSPRALPALSPFSPHPPRALPVARSIFGSSRQLALGPTSLVSLLVNEAIKQMADPDSHDPAEQRLYLGLTLLLSLMLGALQLLAGLLRLGWVVRFLSHAVVSGFSSGAAIMLGLMQMRYFLGYTTRHETMHMILYDIFVNLKTTHVPSLVMGVLALAFLLIMKHLGKRHKRLRILRTMGPIVAAAMGTATIYLLRNPWHIRVTGLVPSGLPSPFSAFPWARWRDLVSPALVIASAAYLETIAIAKTLAAKNGYSVDANQELVALGLANTVGSCFQAFPTGGSFSRSAVSDDCGAATGMAGVVSVLLVLVTLMFLTPLFQFLPLPVLGAILVSSVCGLVDYEEAAFLLRVDPKDFVVWMLAFCGTLFFGIQVNGVGLLRSGESLAITELASMQISGLLATSGSQGLCRVDSRLLRHSLLWHPGFVDQFLPAAHTGGTAGRGASPCTTPRHPTSLHTSSFPHSRERRWGRWWCGDLTAFSHPPVLQRTVSRALLLSTLPRAPPPSALPCPPPLHAVQTGVMVAVVISLGFVINESANAQCEELGRLPGTTVYRTVQQYPDAKVTPGIAVIKCHSHL
ncbi:unnamed protein product [Closterium sp. NIES-53]